MIVIHYNIFTGLNIYFEPVKYQTKKQFKISQIKQLK